MYARQSNTEVLYHFLHAVCKKPSTYWTQARNIVPRLTLAIVTGHTYVQKVALGEHCQLFTL